MSNLQRLLDKKNISRYRLGKLLGVTTKAVSGWCTTDEPSLRMALKIMQVLNCTGYDLLHNKRDKHKNNIDTDDITFFDLE